MIDSIFSTWLNIVGGDFIYLIFTAMFLHTFIFLFIENWYD